MAGNALTESESIERLRAVLSEFVGDIDNTGGIQRDRHGWPAPVADPDWIDLGETYLKACNVLGVEPKIAAGEDVDDATD
jgi:hypothetical protein